MTILRPSTLVSGEPGLASCARRKESEREYMSDRSEDLDGRTI